MWPLRQPQTLLCIRLQLSSVLPEFYSAAEFVSLPSWRAGCQLFSPAKGELISSWNYTTKQRIGQGCFCTVQKSQLNLFMLIKSATSLEQNLGGCKNADGLRSGIFCYHGVGIGMNSMWWGSVQPHWSILPRFCSSSYSRWQLLKVSNQTQPTHRKIA